MILKGIWAELPILIHYCISFVVLYFVKKNDSFFTSYFSYKNIFDISFFVKKKL